MVNRVITITRQYGSGGREIGQKLADAMGVEFFDNKLLEVAADNSGIHKSHFEQNDEKRSNSFLYLLSTAYSQGGVPFDDALFFAQLESIQKIASEQSCVIIGRCADYALRDFSKILNVFICAPFEVRVNAHRRSTVSPKSTRRIMSSVSTNNALLITIITQTSVGVSRRTIRYALTAPRSVLTVRSRLSSSSRTVFTDKQRIIDSNS